MRFPFLALLIALLVGCAPDENTLVVYSGRSQPLVEGVVEGYDDETRLQIRYGRDAEQLLALAEEGDRSSADVFWANSAGTLTAAQAEGRLAPLPDSVLALADAFVPSGGQWLPVTVRFRVLAYAPDRVETASLPTSVMDLPSVEALQGRIGWTPTYSSFHDFVTAMRVVHGDAPAREWLTSMQAMQPRSYPGNSAMLEALAAGEIDVALTNHYYILRVNANEGAQVGMHHFAPGDVGNLALVTGAGVLTTASDEAAAHRFLAYLTSEAAQNRASQQTFEVPVVRSANPPAGLLSFDEAVALGPDVDFEQLADLEGTLGMLREIGLL